MLKTSLMAAFMVVLAIGPAYAAQISAMMLI